VAQVVAQALASLEGQVKGTVTDYVVKVCIFKIEIESSEKDTLLLREIDRIPLGFKYFMIYLSSYY